MDDGSSSCTAVRHTFFFLVALGVNIFATRVEHTNGFSNTMVTLCIMSKSSVVASLGKAYHDIISTGTWPTEEEIIKIKLQKTPLSSISQTGSSA